MFKVRDENWNIYTVYSAKDYIRPSGKVTTRFLIFDAYWTWVDAGAFVPYVEDDIKETEE